jgi:hypothetical protein
MKCTECVKEGKLSTVTVLPPPRGIHLIHIRYRHFVFYDPTGKKHDHYYKTHINNYRCSNGHIFSIKSNYPSCPTCGHDFDKNLEPKDD